jgi:hypothetical protein
MADRMASGEGGVAADVEVSDIERERITSRPA